MIPITLEEQHEGAVTRETCIWAGCCLPALQLLRAPGRTRWVGTCARHETAVRAQLEADARRFAEAQAKKEDAVLVEEGLALAGSRPQS